MPPNVDASLNLTSKIRDVFDSLKSQGEFDVDKVEAMGQAADTQE